MHNESRRGSAFVAALASVVVLAGSVSALDFSSRRVEEGFFDFHYGEAAFESPTAEKPQSKLWFHDGSWWGVLWSPNHANWRILRYDAAQNGWDDMGVALDERPATLVDVLSDGEKLYVASHVRSSDVHMPALLYRLTYDADARSYAHDPGFPVEINQRRSESLVLDKDSTGQLWATWELSGKIWINRSLDNDMVWGEPFQLPVQGSAVKTDDIASIGRFGGNNIGVGWSNQNDGKFYFAVHEDGKSDMDWEPREDVMTGLAPNIGSDDHVSMRFACDRDGCVYLGVKTHGAVNPEDPLVLVLRRDAAGAWTNHVVGVYGDRHTRPILVVDEENREMYVFATTDYDPQIWMKKASLDDLVFPDGDGEPFIMSLSHAGANNPTTTKQNANSETGIFVLASDADTRTYLHNWMPVRQAAPPCEPSRVSTVCEARLWGYVRGSHEATHAADDASQTLAERWYGWTRSVAHGWFFQLPEGGSTFRMSAEHATGRGSDDRFAFFYTTNGYRYHYMMTVSGAKRGEYHSYEFPKELSGVIAVVVVDTNRRRDRYTDILRVDHLVVETPCTDSSSARRIGPMASVVPEELLERVRRIPAEELESLVASESSEVQGPVADAVTELRITSGNHPNPFIDRTAIRFAIPEASRVTVRVFNPLGQEVRTLTDGDVPAGEHEVIWDGRDAVGNPVAAGVYFYRVETNDRTEVRKMSMLR